MFRIHLISLVPAVILSVLPAGCCGPHKNARECAPVCEEKQESRNVFELVRENRAVCSVVLPDEAPKTVAGAVEKFNKTLKNITGTTLPTAKEDVPGNRIVFSLRETDSLLTADNYTIRFPDPRTMEIEGTEDSIQWAFNHIIREFAKAEWILPEECGLSYTALKDLVIPAEPIEIRDVSWPASRCHGLPDIWWTRNLRERVRMVHDLPVHTFPVSKYGKDNSWPEAIMPVHNGKKITALPDPERPSQFWQPCYSNPETAEIAVRNLLEYLEKHPGTLSLCLGVNDNGGYCECAECMKMDKGRRRIRSESYCTFINRVLTKVCEKYPNVIFEVEAYTATYEPPSFKLHPNALPCLAIDFNSCVDPKIMEKHKRIISEWSRKASMIGVWDYSWGYPYPMPRMYAPYHLDMLKYVYEHNGKAYTGQNWVCDAHEGPKHFLITKFLWDSRQDMQKLEEEWYVRCVGKKAAPYLKAYFKVWNDYFTGPAMKTPWGDTAGTVYMTYNDISCVYALREEDIQAADEAMKQVVALAETPQETARAALLMRYWIQTYLRLRMLGTCIYDAQGNIQTKQQALELLKTVSHAPAWQKEYDQINDILIREKDLQKYFTSAGYIRISASPAGWKFENHMLRHILAVSQFADNPEVKKAMDEIAAEPSQYRSVRALCSVLADRNAHQNLLPDGNAENGVPQAVAIHPLTKESGTVSVTEDHAGEGKKAFQVDVGAHHVIVGLEAEVKPGKNYVLSFRAFIPRPSAEGYLMAYGLQKDLPFHVTRGKTWLKLSAGVWQSFAVMTPSEKQDKVWFRICLENFDAGDKVYFDDFRLIEVPEPAAAASASPRK